MRTRCDCSGLGFSLGKLKVKTLTYQKVRHRGSRPPRCCEKLRLGLIYGLTQPQTKSQLLICWLPDQKACQHERASFTFKVLSPLLFRPHSSRANCSDCNKQNMDFYNVMKKYNHLIYGSVAYSEYAFGDF